jgi:hypothetical protein
VNGACCAAVVGAGADDVLTAATAAEFRCAGFGFGFDGVGGV